MKLQYFFLMSILISSLSQAQHVVNTLTRIKFNGKKKALFEWIRDDKNQEFGKTAIIVTKTNKPPFPITSTIKTLTPHNFELIAAGYSFYCKNIKKKQDIYYGAFVINPHQQHFDATLAKQICIQVRNAYIKDHILIETVSLESSDAISAEEKKSPVARKDKKQKSKKTTTC